MNRVGVRLARGIVLGVVILAPLSISDSTPSRLARALEAVRSQDFEPLFDTAGRRAAEPFTAPRLQRFVDELFSLSGKWKAVTRGRASYEHFVRKAFREHVFGDDDLDRVLSEVRKDYLAAVIVSENRLLGLVYEDVRIDRPDLTFDRFRAEYARLADVLAPQVARDLGMNLVSIAGSEAAASLLTAALGSAGVFGTAVAAGAAGGPWTLGASLVVGVAAGFALDAIVGSACEDSARAQVGVSMNDLRNGLIDTVHRALVRALDALLRVQEACLRSLFTGGPHDGLAPRP